MKGTTLVPGMEVKLTHEEDDELVLDGTYFGRLASGQCAFQSCGKDGTGAYMKFSDFGDGKLVNANGFWQMTVLRLPDGDETERAA